MTDPLSQSQTISYDSSFNISSITDSIGQVAAFTYNAQAQPLTVIDARGNTTTYTYDRVRQSAHRHRSASSHDHLRL